MACIYRRQKRFVGRVSSGGVRRSRDDLQIDGAIGHMKANIITTSIRALTNC